MNVALLLRKAPSKIAMAGILILSRLYNASLNLGVAFGAIIDGFIVKYHPWRYIYYVALALIGGITLIIYATFPETAYNRSPHAEGITTTLRLAPIGSSAPNNKHQEELGTAKYAEGETGVRTTQQRRYYLQGLKLWHGTFTEESVWSMAFRPVMLLILPPVLWATLVMSVTIGFIVAITSNVSPAFATAYGFAAWQSGLCFFAAIIGALIGILCGGHLSDWVADYFTQRNGGIREPEMRLPAIMISVITGPLALVLYGVGIKYQLHWIVPTLGIGLSNLIIDNFLWPNADSKSSQFFHHTSYECVSRIYYRQLPPDCRGNRRYSTGIQVSFWLSPWLLH